MAEQNEKEKPAAAGEDSVKESEGNDGQHAEFYDPYKESRLTRMGLTFESFKRAPGTTGYVVIPCFYVYTCSPCRPI
jgi:amino acid transporter